LILHQGAAIEAADLLFEGGIAMLTATTPESADAPEADDSLTGDLKDHERRLILGALSEGNGSRKFAAEKLGISPRTLRYKIARMRDEGVAVPGQ
ncbi:MAG: helix-turn-helix domain-containing protein, partial [Gammaproteobacteria bacterium]